jgi:hypothetical protein
MREHLGAVIATMKLSSDWHGFKTRLDKNYPRQGRPTRLSFDYARKRPTTRAGAYNERGRQLRRPYGRAPRTVRR